MVQFHVAFYSGQKTPAGPRVLKHKRAAVCTRGVICFHPFRFMAGIYKEANPTIHKCVMYLTEWGRDVKCPTWTRVHVGNKAPIFVDDRALHVAAKVKFHYRISVVFVLVLFPNTCECFQYFDKGYFREMAREPIVSKIYVNRILTKKWNRNRVKLKDKFSNTL